MQKIVPCLWYEKDALEAVELYISLVENSRIDSVFRSPVDTPSGPAGSILTVNFTLAGNKYLALNGGRQQPFTDAISFQIFCENQVEVDRLWTAFTKDGTEVQCGWLKDKWGVSWQIVPKRLMELLTDPDKERSSRAMNAMMQMIKIDISQIELAAEGMNK